MKTNTKLDKQLDKLKNILKNSKALTLDEITKAMGWSPKFKKKIEKFLKFGLILERL